MGALAGFRYREIIRRLKRLGLQFHRQAAGSHEIWFNPASNRYTTIPNHPGDMPEGTLRAILKQAGVDADAYPESLFRTAKYRPEFPGKGFASESLARAWAASFVRWYNFDHRHSGIRYVSPAQRHEGDDHAILAARHALYLQARNLNPARWSGATRNWTPVGAVTLNPERDLVVQAHSKNLVTQPLAA